jgi:hypothetical protein
VARSAEEKLRRPDKFRAALSALLRGSCASGRLFWTHIDGWSERVVDYIASMEAMPLR